MSVRTITTKLAVDGEREFKQAIANVNSSLKTMKSDMALVDAQFKGQANSLGALTEKHQVLLDMQAQQEEKVRALTEAVADATEAYGENDKRTDSYRQQLNRARIDLIALNGEVRDNERYLDEARNSADGCAQSIDEFGREVKDATKKTDALSGAVDDLGDEAKGAENKTDRLADSVDDLGDEVGDTERELDGFGKKLAEAFEGAKNADGSWNVEGLISSLGNLKSLLAGGAIIGGLTQLYGSIKDVVEETREYRQIMGTLETSSLAAGYSADKTAEAYEYLYGVLADEQSAATTVANLQAIGLGQQELMQMIEATTGAWATYGDSIPIDGLAEAINETIQTRKVTGVFADVLNWAGKSEDEFNEKLAAANGTMEAAHLVLYQLNSQDLPDAAAAWRENNRDLVEYNEAQSELNDALADLGEVLSPLVTSFTEFKASMLRELTPIISTISDLISKISELGNKKLNWSPDPVDNRWEENFGPESEGYRTDGSHASGLARVPRDGYVAELHKDEMVLTREQAEDYRKNERELTASQIATAQRVETVLKVQAESPRETLRGDSGDAPQVIEIHTHVDLDGREVGKTVTRYQQNEGRARGK